MKRQLAFVLLVVGAGALGACREGGSPPPATKPAEEAHSDQPANDMRGMAGMMGTDDMMHGGMCAGMMGDPEVSVEKTARGAVLRLTARDDASVEKVQRMADMMRDCMTARSGAGTKTTGQ